MQRNPICRDPVCRSAKNSSAFHLPAVPASATQKKAKQVRPQIKWHLVKTIEAATDCVIAIDARNKILEFNIGAQRTLGYSQEDVIGRRLTETVICLATSESHHGEIASLLKASRAVQGKQIAALAVREDGSKFPVELTVTKIRGQRPPIFIAYLRNVTGRKAAQKTDKEFVDEARSVFEDKIRLQSQLSEAKHIAPIGSWSRDLLTGKVRWSEEMYLIFSRTSFESTYDAVAGFPHPKRRGPFRARRTPLLEMLHPYDLFNRIVGPDGIKRVLHHHIAVETDPEGQPISVYGTAQDVTEATEAAEKIRKQADLLDLACDAIMVRNVEDRFEFWNEGKKRIHDEKSQTPALNGFHIEECATKPRNRDALLNTLSHVLGAAYA